MKQYFRRTPKDYDGAQITSHTLRELLPSLLKEIGSIYTERGDLILASWPEIIGANFAPMTRAVSFEEGILTVIVKNSTLLSLLTQHDKPRILKSLRAKFPTTHIKNIIFRIG